MTIDTKRLKTDAAYWDEVAPEGATHLIDTTFTKWENGVEFDYFEEDERWREAGVQWPLKKYMDRQDRWLVIPRPTKPAAPEWKGWGIPPVGKEVEYEALHDWRAVKITAVGEKHILMNYGGVEICRCIQDSRFRPIRTAEQRQREELANEVSKAMYKVGYAPNLEDPESIADAILSRYNLEPKP